MHSRAEPTAYEVGVVSSEIGFSRRPREGNVAALQRRADDVGKELRAEGMTAAFLQNPDHREWVVRQGEPVLLT